METSGREFIRSNSSDLESRVDFDKIKKLIEKMELLSLAKIQAICSKELSLFEEVAKMSSPDFSVFVDILRDTGHDILADWLTNEEQCSKLYYPLNSNPLGYCMIINIVNFMAGNVKLFEERATSDQEAENLGDMFEKIGYKVLRHRNLSVEAMKGELIKFSRLDHSVLDSSVVFVSTHGMNYGGQDVLVGSDGNFIDKESIYDIFSNQNCESLRRKPKIFFFDACRYKSNNHLSKGVFLLNIQDNEPAEYFNVCENNVLVIEGKSYIRSKNSGPIIKTLGFSEKNPKRKPEFSDIFVVHSSLPGKVSVEEGQLNQPSVFCQKLVEVFIENYKSCDLDTLMNLLTKEVGDASQSKEDTSVHFEKISPYGLVHFYRGRVLEVDQDPDIYSRHV